MEFPIIGYQFSLVMKNQTTKEDDCQYAIFLLHVFIMTGESSHKLLTYFPYIT